MSNEKEMSLQYGSLSEGKCQKCTETYFLIHTSSNINFDDSNPNNMYIYETVFSLIS